MTSDLDDPLRQLHEAVSDRPQPPADLRSGDADAHAAQPGEPPLDLLLPRAEPSARPFSPVLARDTDPETSHDAASSVLDDGTVETHERRILAVLADELRASGGTASEIAAAVRERWGIDREIIFCAHTVSRRLYGLVAAGLIFRRFDPKRPGKHTRRGGETIHYLTPGDAPLWSE